MLPLQDFKDYIHKNSLFEKTSKILIAVSGGKDSVLMVHLFKLAGFNFGIAHCNFNLRGKESQRDENFVRSLAITMEVPFHVIHFNTAAHAAAHKISTQMAARDLRYQWFEQIRQQENYEAIAIAHHQNDAVETVLLNLTRGTGIAGLHGILPKRGQLIRPLLFLNSRQINEIITENHIDFVEDSSNQKDNYARNKLRHHVIPQLKLINTSLEQTFQQNIRRFAETEMVLQQVIAELRKQIGIDKPDGVHFSIKKIAALIPQRLLLYELLHPYHFTEPVVADVLQTLHHQSGTSFYSDTHRLTIDRTDLIVTTILPSGEQHDILINSTDAMADLGQQQILISYTSTNHFGKEQHQAYLDADLLIFPLRVRKRQEGDRFIPLGMKTFKKLSDFFIDEKVPLPQKDTIPILINGNGEVIWIAGLRHDNRYKVTATTKKVAIFELKFK